MKSKDFDVTKLYDKKTYKKNTNIKKAEYFINQADEILVLVIMIYYLLVILKNCQKILFNLWRYMLC